MCNQTLMDQSTYESVTLVLKYLSKLETISNLQKGPLVGSKYEGEGDK